MPADTAVPPVFTLRGVVPTEPAQYDCLPWNMVGTHGG